MARHAQDQDARALGEALARLRRDAGLSQAEAGAVVGMTGQGWGLYESGRRSGLFRPDVQRRLAAAVGGSPESLALALRSNGVKIEDAGSTGVEATGRAYRAGPVADPKVETLQLSNDDLAPWAASGVVLEFDAGRWPRRDQGCVIDLLDGTRLIRLYDRADGDRLFLRGGAGGLERIETVAREEIRRVCAVIARREA